MLTNRLSFPLDVLQNVRNLSSMTLESFFSFDVNPAANFSRTAKHTVTKEKKLTVRLTLRREYGKLRLVYLHNQMT